MGETFFYDGTTHTFLPPFYPFMSQTVSVVIDRGAIDDPKATVLSLLQSILKAEFRSLLVNEFPLEIIATEKEWFAHKLRTVIGVVLQDNTDQDWSYVILAKDKKGVFRWVDGQVSLDSRERARDMLVKRMQEMKDSQK